MNLEDIALEMDGMSLGQQVSYLTSLGRLPHRRSGGHLEALEMIEEDSERFRRIGARISDRASFDGTDEEYAKVCISDARYLYEQFPLIFEFYDELMNGNILKDDIVPKEKSNNK